MGVQPDRAQAAAVHSHKVIISQNNFVTFYLLIDVKKRA